MSAVIVVMHTELATWGSSCTFFQSELSLLFSTRGGAGYALSPQRALTHGWAERIQPITPSFCGGKKDPVMWSSSLRQEEHLYFVSLPSLEGFFFPQRSTSQSLEMTPNKKPKLNAELLPPCTRVLSQTCITRCCCNSSSAWSQRSSCAFRSARSPLTPTPPPFRQQGGLKCLTGSSCVAVAICHRVYCCPPDSHLSDRFTGTSETLNALSLPCRKCLLNQSFFWKTVEISTQLSAVTLNPLRASTFTPAAGRDVGVVGWWGGGVRLSNVDFSLPEMKWTRGFVFSQANENSAVFMVGWWEQNWGREGNQQWENK